jgi:NTP pyrophosphatase (non-canonical NTP hydrolase)
MPMNNKGLTKLIEECSELSQIAAKKIAFLHTDFHPDGNGSMKDRLEDEIADVMAAAVFVASKLDLDPEYIDKRCKRKLLQFAEWDAC